MPAAIEEKHSE